MVAISQLKWEEWKQINNTILILTSKYKIKTLIIYNSKELHPLNLKGEILNLNIIPSLTFKQISIYPTHMDNRSIITSHLPHQRIIKTHSKMFSNVYRLIVLLLNNINSSNKLVKDILLIKMKDIIKLHKWTCIKNQFNK